MIGWDERYWAEMVLGVIDSVEYPILIYEGEKAIVRKALKAYIESNGTADDFHSYGEILVKTDENHEKVTRKE